MKIHTALIMLAGNRRRLRQALDAGSADIEFAALGVLYVARLERLVREGRRDGEFAVAIASRLARVLTQTPALDEDRAIPRQPPGQPAGFPARIVTEVYRHTRRRCWSLREGGRVVAHVEAVTLADVALIVRPGALARVRNLRVREVCALARGTPTDAPRPRGARRLRFDPFGEGAFLADGVLITAAAAAWFEADGTAWISLED